MEKGDRPGQFPIPHSRSDMCHFRKGRPPMAPDRPGMRNGNSPGLSPSLLFFLIFLFFGLFFANLGGLFSLFHLKLTSQQFNDCKVGAITFAVSELDDSAIPSLAI